MTPLKNAAKPAIVFHKANRAKIENSLIEKEEPLNEFAEVNAEVSYSDLTFEDLETKK